MKFRCDMWTLRLFVCGENISKWNVYRTDGLNDRYNCMHQNMLIKRYTSITTVFYLEFYACCEWMNDSDEKVISKVR
jgi:hypothetical protein